MFILLKYILITISLILIILCCIFSFFGFSVYELLNYTLISDKNYNINNEIDNRLQDIINKNELSFFIINSLYDIKKISGKINFDFIKNNIVIENHNLNLYNDKAKLLTIFMH